MKPASLSAASALFDALQVIRTALGGRQSGRERVDAPPVHERLGDPLPVASQAHEQVVLGDLIGVADDERATVATAPSLDEAIGLEQAHRRLDGRAADPEGR
jgi:hypothetical protein